MADGEKLIVKLVDDGEEKSAQQIEQELLDKDKADKEKLANAGKSPEDIAAAAKAAKEGTDVPKFGEKDVLTYLKENHKAKGDSIEDILKRPEVVELPEVVEKYLEYKKDTNRTFEDYMRSQEDFDKMSDDHLLARYYMDKTSGLDADDAGYMINEKFGTAADADEDEKRTKGIAKKTELAEARNHFNTIKEKYKAPAESVNQPNTGKNDVEYQAYKDKLSTSKETEKQSQAKFDFFGEETAKVFSDDFKGFEFVVGEEKMVFKSGEADKLQKAQADLNTFVAKYVDDKTGLINDPVGYHKALNAAMNADALAQHFYNKGVADQVKGDAAKAKNIQSGTKGTAGNLTDKDATKVKAVSAPSSRGLTMK